MLRIRLDTNGQVAAVESVAPEELTSLRRIVKTSDGSFPVVKLTRPILEVPHTSEIWEQLKKRKTGARSVDLLSRAFSDCEIRPWSKSGWMWRDSLQEAKLLRDALEGDEIGAAIALLSCRFEEGLKDERSINRGIGGVALKALRQGTLSQYDAVHQLLVGKGKDSRGSEKKISVFLALDLDDSARARVPVYEQRVWRRVSDILPTNMAAKEREHQHRAPRSAFGGGEKLLQEPFPAVKLPVLGAYFPLVSMASDDDKAKCNKRYGLTEYAVVPVTKAEAMRMQDALAWVLDDNRRGKTWRGVASGRFEVVKTQRGPRKVETKDLLIVFVDEIPHLDARTASYFGPTSDTTSAKFEVDAGAVCEALDGVAKKRPHARLQLFLIRKATDGQAQVVLAESPTVVQVLDAAERWQRGVYDNLPSIKLRLPPDRNREHPIDAHPWPPYPEQVVKLLSYQWVRDGSSRVMGDTREKPGGDARRQKPNHAVVGLGLGDVLTLMLRTEGKWRQAANQMLALLLQRVAPLLVGVFGAAGAFGPRQEEGKHEPLDDYPRESCEVALQAIAVFGILLHELDCRKEVYVENAPYQVGQVLALADTIHKDYCVVVRKGSMPNSLIGTALMRRALDNPAGALADLSERMIEYLRWAKTAEVPKDAAENDPRKIAVFEARKRLRQYQPLGAKLGIAVLPTECTDIMKAQLLLGFLASPPTGADHQDEMGGEK
jgi:hypothetical protein